jgi:hypothetical protein
MTRGLGLGRRSLAFGLLPQPGFLSGRQIAGNARSARPDGGVRVDRGCGGDVGPLRADLGRVTVIVATAGMFIRGDKSFESFAAATILLVAISVVGSLTVLPALLSKLGDNVNKGRVPFLRSPDSLSST